MLKPPLDCFDGGAFSFCLIDDFCQQFEPLLEQRLPDESSDKRRRRMCEMSLSEMTTMVVLAALLKTLKGACTGLSIADATPLAVCYDLRIQRHRVFKGIAQRGKSSTGWFYDFKLHAVINHQGERLAIKVTAGNVDDRKGLLAIASGLFGTPYADKGYIGKEFAQKMKNKGIDLVTRVRKNRKEVMHFEFDQALLRKRSLVETVFDELKNRCQIEHTRNRLPMNFAVNLMAGIVAYCLQPVSLALQYGILGNR